MASKYNIDYNKRTEGLVTIHTIGIKRIVPNIYSFLCNETIGELNTDSIKAPKFRIRIGPSRLQTHYFIIEFLSTNSVFVRSVLTKGSECSSKGYRTVQADEWEHLDKLDESTLEKCLNKKNIFYLGFQFIVLNQPKAQLSNDLQNLLNDGLHSDVTMKSAEGVEYKVHKAVLASRSDVLKATFEHNTTECSTNIVESHLESDILREVLKFIYSDKAPRVDEIAEKLLAAAEYYQLSGLKNLCGKALGKKLTVENAIETLQLADLHSANTLKQLTVEFIKDGRAKLVLKTEGWAQLKSVELIKKIYEYYIMPNLCLVLDEPKAQLSNNLQNLLNDGLYSDVTMKSAEGIEYKVHKNVLASRSAVLKANFEHNTTECFTNIVESHLESDILREVLTFIYSDEAPRVDEMAEKLLAAADYYQLNRLKGLCERALHKKLTVENAIETLQLADLHSANTLKRLTLEFIKDGRASLLVKTESWAQLKSVELIKTIKEHYIMGDE